MTDRRPRRCSNSRETWPPCGRATDPSVLPDDPIPRRCDRRRRHALNYLPDYFFVDRALVALARALKPGGLLATDLRPGVGGSPSRRGEPRLGRRGLGARHRVLGPPAGPLRAADGNVRSRGQRLLAQGRRATRQRDGRHPARACAARPARCRGGGHRFGTKRLPVGLRAVSATDRRSDVGHSFRPMPRDIRYLGPTFRREGLLRRHLGSTSNRLGRPFVMLTRVSSGVAQRAPELSAARSMPDGREPSPGGWNRFVLEVDDLEAEVTRLRVRRDVPQRRGPRTRRRPDVLEDRRRPMELFQPRRDRTDVPPAAVVAGALFIGPRAVEDVRDVRAAGVSPSGCG